MFKRILSILLALVLLSSALSALADVSPLTEAEIAGARSLIAMDGDIAGWQKGDPVNASMNALQAQQYLEWLTGEWVGGLMNRIQDGVQLVNMAQAGKAASLEGVGATVQRLNNSLIARRDALDELRRSIYNDLYRLENAEITDRERVRIALRVREDAAEIQGIIQTVAKYYDEYHEQIENSGLDFANILNSVDSPDGALTNSAADRLLSEASALTAAEQAQIDAQNGVDFDVIVLSSKQFGFIVRDAGGKPMKGVQVKVTGTGGSKADQTKKTDANGLVTFLVMDFNPDEKNRVVINAVFTQNLYCTREMRGMTIRGGMAETVRLDVYSGQPFLRMAGYNGRDVLSQQNTIFYTPKNDGAQHFEILVDDLKKNKISGFLYLCYQTYDSEGKIVDKEERRSFTAGTSVTFQNPYGKILAPGTAVTVRVEAGTFVKTYSTQMRVEKAVVDEPQFLNTNNLSFTGSGLSMTFPSSIPFIGGKKLMMDMPFAPAQLMIDPTGYIQFAFGKSFQSEELSWKYDSLKDKEQQLADANRQAQRDANAVDNKVYKNAGATSRKRFLGDVTAAITVFAGLQGKVREDATRFSLTGAGGVQAAFKGGYGWQFLVGGVIPIFAAMDFAFSLGASFGLGLEADLPDFGNAKFLFNKGQGLTIDILAELGVSAGLGVRGLVNVALRFFGNIAPKVRLTNPVSAAVNMGFGLDVTAQAFVAKWKETLWKGTYSYDTSANGDDLNETGGAQVFTQIEDGVNIPSAANGLPIANGGDGLRADSETEVFARIDSLAGELQYATLTSPDGSKSATFGFWITPTTDSGKRKGELVWYNLDAPESHGLVYPEAGGDAWRATEATDYAFAIMGHGDFVGVTILSGVFADREDNRPVRSRMSVAVMQVVERADGTLGLGISNTAGDYRENEWSTNAESWNGSALSRPLTHFVNNAPGDASRNLWYINAACDYEWVSSGETNGVVSVDIQRTAKDLIHTAATNDNPEFGDYTTDPATITRCLAIARPTNAKLGGGYVADDRSLSCYYRLKVAEKAKKEMNEKTELFVHLNGTKQKLDENVEYFTPMIEYGALQDAQEFLFYLKKGQADDGSACYRLMGASRVGNGKFAVCDYDVPMYAEHFKITTLDDGSTYGITYLYWTECVAAGEYTENEKYQIRCVRFDRETNTMSAPFTLLELSEQPESLHLLMNGVGYYTTALTESMQSNVNAESAAVNQRLIRFTFSLQTAVSLTGVAPYDPCVCAGEYASLLFAVKNTGNLPVSRFMVAILKEGETTPVQTVIVNCSNPENESVNSLFGSAADSAYSVTRVGSIYDDMNGDDWLVTTTQNGVTVAEQRHTELLMPGGVHTYQASFKVPEDWNGTVRLTAELGSVFALTHYSNAISGSGANAMDTEVGFDAQGNMISNNANAPMLLGVKRAGVPESEMKKEIGVGRGDLMLDCQAYTDPAGAQYVRVSIVGRSETDSRIAPTLTAALNGTTVLSYTFTRAIDEDFGYTLDIPAERLLAGRASGEVTFTLTDNEQGNEFAEFDNQCTLTLGSALSIQTSPQSTAVAEGEEAVFAVSAIGGAAPYRYQWQRMNAQGVWEDVAGANQAEYRILAATENDGAQFRCVVTDAMGNQAISEPARLTLGLKILSQPQDQLVAAGQRATFTVAAAGEELTYQWYIARKPGEWKKIDGAVGASYMTAVTELTNSGYQYGCLIADAHGRMVRSAIATLYVTEAVEPPETGDASMPEIWLAIALIGAAGLILLRRKRRAA